MRHRENIVINEKRVRRIMKEENLMMEAKKYKAKRTPQRRKGGQDSISISAEKSTE
ncbi:MAG: hypothetical protein RBS14_03840 [Atribacterota bacterium]|nr:hypothetical protein [Atribacterota bacterium]